MGGKPASAHRAEAEVDAHTVGASDLLEPGDGRGGEGLGGEGTVGRRLDGEEDDVGDAAEGGGVGPVEAVVGGVADDAEGLRAVAAQAGAPRAREGCAEQAA
jgi:hypothetical protein